MVFDKSKSLTGIPEKLPCGRCIGCRLEKSAEWAGRIMNEAQMHMDSIMCTLTYSDEHLPDKSCIQYSDMQRFYKRLRKSLDGQRIKHFTGCEYGEQTERPHYHAIIFGYRPDDAELFYSNGPQHHFISESLTKIWGLGHVEFTDVTFESAQYVAQYCTKKVTGKEADDHYERIDVETGERYWLVPEQAHMSLGYTCRKCGDKNCKNSSGAIGAEWLKKYESDVYPRDEYMPKPGMTRKAPKYYDVLLERKDPYLHQAIKNIRKKEAHKRALDNTPGRLASKEKVTRARLNQKAKKL